MDNLINCARCGSDACYVDEVNQDIKTQFCYGCGFQTNSLMKVGENFYEQQIGILPELYKDLLIEDHQNLVWMPSSVNIPTQGMVFANGSSLSDWGWAAVKATKVTEEEKEKYPIPKQPGKYYEYKMNMETIQHFEERDFIDALEYIGLLG